MKKNVFVIAIGLMLASVAFGESVVTFRLTGVPENIASVGVRGNLPPLSWDRSLELGGTRTLTVAFAGLVTPMVLEYKFVVSDGKTDRWEFDGSANRVAVLTPGSTQQLAASWDQPAAFDVARLPPVPREALLADFAILKEAVMTLHPGLYRYNDDTSLAAHFLALEAAWSRDLRIRDAHLALARFAAAIRCGHTRAGPYNQSGLVAAVLLEQADRLPFAFRIIGDRMIVSRSASGDPVLFRGVEVIAINDVSVKELFERMLPLIPADGSNDAMRRYLLQVHGNGELELFDFLLPALVPPLDGQYRLGLRNPTTAQTAETRVAGLRLTERNRLLGERYPDFMAAQVDDRWMFRLLDEDTGLLTLETFAIWNMKMDWRNWLRQVFETLSKEDVAHLIIDIRGNGGGLDEVSAELQKYVVGTDFQAPSYQTKTRYARVPPSIRPYVSSWDSSFYDLSSQVRKSGNGFYQPIATESPIATIEASGDAYHGHIYFLVDEANGSATFYMRRLIGIGKLGVQVGGLSGASRRGFNGGQIAFLRLPNSGLELDIPLFASFARDGVPDEALVPDYVVRQSIDDLKNGVDTQLEFVRELIRERTTDD